VKDFTPSVTCRASLAASFCSQLPASFRFNKDVSSASDQPIRPHWLRVVLIGRRPKATLARIAALVVVCFVTFKFILLPIRVDGISMLPTYHTGQVDCVNTLAYLFHEPRRGDIVSVRLAGKHVMFMKRIIGLPGETVAFHDGKVYINGQPLDEPYVKLDCDWEMAPVRCSPNEYYVVGDNRSMPIDLHTKGRAERERIVGKLFL
jgi:signal peptidase I